MNFEQLKAQIAEIVAVCRDVPEEFRGRCFELLMNALLDQRKKRDKPYEESRREQGQEETPQEEQSENAEEKQKSFTIPGHVRAFLRKHELPESVLTKLVMIEGQNLHWLKEPSHSNIRRGQNEWALLLALKGALLGKAALSVDPEEVRSAAQDKGFYDKKNFATSFKSDPYQSWYKGEMVAQGAAQALTKEGETALADLIKGLTGLSGS